MSVPWLCEPFNDTDRICRSDRNVPFHFTKLFFPGPLICILLTSTITKLTMALVWSVQLELTAIYLLLGKWFFRDFKQEFLLNGKRVQCLRRNFGSARRLTLPLQKGDWTRWVTLLVACSRLSDSGRSESKRKAKNCSFLPFYFRVRAFSIQRARLSRSVEQATLLAEPTFCNLNGSPCFVKKCLKRCLFQESSGRRVTLLLETNIY